MIDKTLDPVTDTTLDPVPAEAVTVSVDADEILMDPRKRLVHDHLDGIQHGIDDNPENDPAKGSALGALGGAAVGITAGTLLGPVGMLVGGLVGAASGAVLSGLAVAGVDAIDNDDNVTGVGAEVAIDLDETTPPAVSALVREKHDL